MNMLPLLIELGTEELPPKALPELAQAFLTALRLDLKNAASRSIKIMRRRFIRRVVLRCYLPKSAPNRPRKNPKCSALI